MNISPIRPVITGQNVYRAGNNGGLNNRNKNVNTSSPAFGAVIGNASDLKIRLDFYVKMAKDITPDEIRNLIKMTDASIISILNQRNSKLAEIRELPKLIQKFKKGAVNKIEEEFVSRYIALNNEKKKLLAELEKRLEDIKHIADNMQTEITQSGRGTVSVSKALRAGEQAKYAAYSQYKGFDSIAGYEYEKAVLDRFFISEIKKERAGQEANVPGSVLFFGPQGNGKTSFAKAFAQEADARVEYIDTNSTRGKAKNRFDVFLDELLNEAKLAEEHYQKGGNNQRTILILDEFDNVAGKNSPITKELEKFLQKCSDKYHCTVFATTNYPERIAMNLKKENSAFPYRVALDPPSAADKAGVLEFYTRGREVEALDIPAAVRKIEEKENIEESLFCNAFIKKIALGARNQEEMYKMIEKIHPNISKEELKTYHETVKLLTEGKVLL